MTPTSEVDVVAPRARPRRAGRSGGLATPERGQEV
jgi:hypothetical protein